MVKTNRIIVLILALLILFVIILLATINANAQDDGCFIVDWNGELYEVCPHESTNTPTSTATPTATPSPTNTPAPTDTPEPAPTLTPYPTPTQEIACALRNTTGDTIRVRSAPQIVAWNAIGVVLDQNIIYPEGYYDDPYYRWYYFWFENQWGWTANQLDEPNSGNQDGWYTQLGPCDDLIEMHPMIDGFHLLIGAQEVTLNYLPFVVTLKSLTHSDNLTKLAKQIKPSVVTVYRSLYNCHGQIDGPLLDEQRNADLYWACLRPFLPAGSDYYEVINEWGFESRAQEADWHIRLLELMAGDGYCGLAFSDGPGNPEILAWDEYVRVLRWIDDHPCGKWPSGRLKYHGIALHQSGKLPDWVSTLPDNYSKNVWVYNRHQIVDLYLRANFDYSLEDFKGPIYITEMGFEDYTIPNEEFTCEEVKSGLIETRYLYRLTNIIDGFHLWNFWGSNSIGWVELTACLPVIYG
jgi:hypothetical protein